MARAAAAAAAAVAEVRVMETVEAKVMVTAEEATAGEGAEMRVMETVMEGAEVRVMEMEEEAKVWVMEKVVAAEAVMEAALVEWWGLHAHLWRCW